MSPSALPKPLRFLAMAWALISGKLSKLLQYHSDLYYNKQMPIISDYEYDMLFKKLQFLKEKFEVWKKQTLKVWSDVIISSTFEKVAHSRPMISLDNTYNEEDLRFWWKSY